MWISGGPLVWLCLVYFYVGAFILVGAAWVIVALVQLLYYGIYYGIRALVRAIGRKRN
jgi:hypothetical protein